MAIKVFLADDHGAVRDGLRLLLESHSDIEVIGEAADGRQMVRGVQELRPDVVVVDIAMPELNGIDATRHVRASSPSTRVVVLSMHSGKGYIAQALQAGAQGYVLKESAGQEVVSAVRTVHSGHYYLSRRVTNIVLDDYVEQLQLSGKTRSPVDCLSPREREVLQLVGEGKSSAEIASILYLSRKTVESHRSRLMRKLNISHVPGLVKFAIQHGLTSLKQGGVKSGVFRTGKLIRVTDDPIAWHALEDRSKIMRIITQLISQKRAIKIRLGTEKAVFNSRFIDIIPGAVSSNTQGTDQLIIDELIPDSGNSLVPSSAGMLIEFLLKDNVFRFRTGSNGINNTVPSFGFVVSFPKCIEVQEKRREKRFTFEEPKVISVEFAVKKRLQQDKIHTLNALDFSKHGLGLLVTQEDFGLLQILNPGDSLQSITIYAASATIRLDRIVRHKTKISDGAYKGCYILGIESRDTIENGDIA